MECGDHRAIITLSSIKVCSVSINCPYILKEYRLRPPE